MRMRETALGVTLDKLLVDALFDEKKWRKFKIS
jgi:hypothetical protein